MIGLDSNVLLRFVLGDDPVQSPAAERLIRRLREDGETLFIADTTLAEFTWVLRKEGWDRRHIADGIRLLLNDSGFAFTRRDEVEWALARYLTGPAGFVDCLTLARNTYEGCTATYSFAGPAQRGLGFRAP